ncbi:MAG: glycosyltransferase, partial [Acidobacteriales bacterium]|nr:glycosyltransferase [Terriglobales bacterium]
MDLSIIIVNWNSVGFVTECVSSIQQSTHDLSYEIIVIDNASAAEDLKRLETNISGIKLIKSAENLGFARANNLGCTHSTGDYLLFLNPDTKVIGPAITVMLNEIRRLPDAGVVGCKLLNTDLTVQLSSIQKFPT